MIIFSLYSKGQEREGGERNLQKLRFWVFIERGSDFSLRSRVIGPSDFFGPRKKVVYAVRASRGHQFYGVSTNSVR